MRLALVLLALAIRAPVAAGASTPSPEGRRILAQRDREERERAEVVVVGRWQGSCDHLDDQVYYCRGTVVPTRHRRGKRLAEYRIDYREELDLISGSNHPPEAGTCARFYLQENRDWRPGSYEVLQYKSLSATSKACAK